MSSWEMFDKQQRMGINLSNIDNLSKDEFIRQCTSLSYEDTEMPTPIDVYDSFSNFVPEQSKEEQEDEVRESADERFSSTRA